MAAHIGRARGRDIGRLGGNIEVLEEMRELRAHMESMETNIWRDPKARDLSEPENEEQREEAAPMQETQKLRCFGSILGSTSRPRPEFPTYDGSLLAEHLIDWINEMDKYFEYDEV